MGAWLVAIFFAVLSNNYSEVSGSRLKCLPAQTTTTLSPSITPDEFFAVKFPNDVVVYTAFKNDQLRGQLLKDAEFYLTASFRDITDSSLNIQELSSNVTQNLSTQLLVLFSLLENENPDLEAIASIQKNLTDLTLSYLLTVVSFDKLDLENSEISDKLNVLISLLLEASSRLMNLELNKSDVTNLSLFQQVIDAIVDIIKTSRNL